MRRPTCPSWWNGTYSLIQGCIHAGLGFKDLLCALGACGEGPCDSCGVSFVCEGLLCGSGRDSSLSCLR